MNLSLATLDTIERLKCKGDQMKAIICGALMALTITTANAAEGRTDTVNYLLPYCKLSLTEPVASKAFINGRCYGMVEAIVNMYSLVTLYDDQGNERFERGHPCADIPEHITYEQAVRAVIRYADTHSEAIHLTFTVLAMVALEKAWPCK